VIRQRLRLRRSPLAFIGRGLLVLVALAFVWYGAMVCLLAFKVSPETVHSISGYRTAYDFLAGLTPGDIDDRVRLTAGLAGLAALIVFGYLAFRELPRPHLARSGVNLTKEDARGATAVAPRALERAAEIAVAVNPAVVTAAGRLDDDEMSINLRIRQARDLPGALRDTQRRARQALDEHGVPVTAVNVTITGFDRSTRRELS